MQLSLAFSTLLLTTSLAQQVILIPSTLPACAASCSALNNAQTLCVPPSAPVSNDATYTSCFCQSNYLSALKTSSANLCAPQCTDGDFSTIDSWFNGFCGVNAAVGPPTTIATTLATTTTPVVTPSAIATATAAGNVGVTQGNPSTSSGHVWFNSHWRWVVMVIVLAIGLIILSVVASLFHRRHQRRREAAENLGPRPDLGTWGPNGHSIHDFGVHNEDGQGGVKEEKGKGRAGEVRIQEAGVQREMSKGKRLKKG